MLKCYEIKRGVYRINPDIPSEDTMRFLVKELEDTSRQLTRWLESAIISMPSPDFSKEEFEAWKAAKKDAADWLKEYSEIRD